MNKYYEYKKQYYLKHYKEIRQYQKDYYQKNKKEFAVRGKKYYHKIYHKKFKEIMHELKKHGCCICGYNSCDKALEFHHVIPENKLFNLKQSRLGFSTEKILEEFYKCMLLCSNCHRELETEED